MFHLAPPEVAGFGVMISTSLRDQVVPGLDPFGLPGRTERVTTESVIFPRTCCCSSPGRRCRRRRARSCPARARSRRSRPAAPPRRRGAGRRSSRTRSRTRRPRPRGLVECGDDPLLERLLRRRVGDQVDLSAATAAAPSRRRRRRRPRSRASPQGRSPRSPAVPRCATGGCFLLDHLLPFSLF